MAFKMKGSPMERNFGLSSIASKNKSGGRMGITGALGLGKNPMRKNDKKLPAAKMEEIERIEEFPEIPQSRLFRNKLKEAKRLKK